MTDVVKRGRGRPVGTPGIKKPPRLDIYRYIVDYKLRNGGDSPTRRDIVDAINVPLSMVNYYLARLEEEGLIRVGTGGRARAIEVVGGRWLPPIEGVTVDDIMAARPGSSD